MAKNLDSELALADCNEAMRLDPKDIAYALANRSLIYLRLRRWDEALAGYEAFLKLKIRMDAGFYGRGVARLGKGDIAGGNADIAAAKEIDPKIAETFARYGVKPP